MNEIMEPEVKKEFDAVQFFREVKEKIGLIMTELTFEERKKFIEKIKSGEITSALIDKYLRKEIQLTI
jgi:hypothetical protein